jgi:hypothetical protein
VHRLHAQPLDGRELRVAVLLRVRFVEGDGITEAMHEGNQLIEVRDRALHLLAVSEGPDQDQDHRAESGDAGRIA